MAKISLYLEAEIEIDETQGMDIDRAKYTAAYVLSDASIVGDMMKKYHNMKINIWRIGSTKEGR